MAKKNRLSKKILQEDRDSYAALKALTDYAPSNADFTLAKVDASQQTMEIDQTDEVQKHAAADASTDRASGSEHEFHAMILGAKNQVKAQYGEDSDEYASLGLKKKSEYKRGRRLTPKTGGGNA